MAGSSFFGSVDTRTPLQLVAGMGVWFFVVWPDVDTGYLLHIFY